MNGMLNDLSRSSYDLVELDHAEIDFVGGAMTAAEAGHWGDVAAGIRFATALVDLEPISAAAFGFAAGSYLGAASMS